MLQTSPFILFDGNCKEAMSFYQECLGGENDKIDLSATDWMASPMLEPIQGNTFSIYLTGDSYDELKPVFDKLADGDETYDFICGFLVPSTANSPIWGNGCPL